MFLFVRRACLFALALAASVCAAGAASAQSRDGSKAAECRVSGLSFACPEDFAPAAAQPGEDLLFMRHREYEMAVFVAAPAAPLDAKAFEAGLPAVAASKLVPDDARPYEWRPMEAPKRLGRHDRASAAAQGFNGVRRVFVEFHRLSFGGRDLYVGHVFAGARDRRREEARLFSLGLGSSSVVSECGVQDAVGALTGERIDPRGTACAMMVRPGQGPSRLPGPKSKDAVPRAKVVPTPRP